MKTDWHQIVQRALVYVEANAWESAEARILPYVTHMWKLNNLPAECIETAALLVMVWRRLGKLDPAEEGTTRIRKTVEDRFPIAPRARMAIALCFATEDLARGRYDATEGSLRDADTIGENDVDAWFVCKRELLWSRLYLFRNDLFEAEDRALTAARYAVDGHNDGQLGDAYVLLAVIARRRGRIRESITLHEKARSSYLRIGDGGAATVVSLNLGSSYVACGEIEDALSHFSKALRLALRDGRQGTALRALLGQGYCQIRLGRIQQARKGLLTALRSAQRLVLPREETLALEYLTYLAVVALRPERARVALHLARRRSVSLGEPADLRVQINLQEARLLLVTGQGSRAIAVARKAVGDAGRQGLRWEQALGLVILGIAHFHRGSRGRASKVLRAAKQLLDENCEVLDRALVSAWLTMIGTRDGEKAKQAIREQLDRMHGARESAQFAMNHPVFGPLGWMERRSGQTKDLALKACKTTDPFDAMGATSVSCEVARRESYELWGKLGLTTRSSMLRQVLHSAETYASANLPVLILGESGTGKDLVAQGIHDLSGHGGRYVPVNCAAASRELFVAELFGAVKGAYTGAVETREGLVVRARGGTIFLDEIADLDLDAQGYLLRFLDSGEVRPVGSTESKRVEARVIAATCRDLKTMVKDGAFRADLLNRLSGLRVRLPALRERLEDLELLIESLWLREGGVAGAWPAVFNRAIVGRLSRERWPGNVRELRHMVARALQFSRKHGDAAARQELLRDLEDPHRHDAEPSEAVQTST